MGSQYILCEDCNILWSIEEYSKCPVCHLKEKTICDKCNQPISEHDDGECPSKIRQD